MGSKKSRKLTEETKRKISAGLRESKAMRRTERQKRADEIDKRGLDALRRYLPSGMSFSYRDYLQAYQLDDPTVTAGVVERSFDRLRREGGILKIDRSAYCISSDPIVVVLDDVGTRISHGQSVSYREKLEIEKESRILSFLSAISLTFVVPFPFSAFRDAYLQEMGSSPMTRVESDFEWARSTGHILPSVGSRSMYTFFWDLFPDKIRTLDRKVLYLSLSSHFGRAFGTSSFTWENAVYILRELGPEIPIHECFRVLVEEKKLAYTNRLFRVVDPPVNTENQWTSLRDFLGEIDG